MALMNCPECKKEISDQAGSCPNCGYELKGRGEWYEKTGFVVLWIFLFWPVGLFGLFKTSKIKKPIKIIAGSIIGLLWLLIIIAMFSIDTGSQTETSENNTIETKEESKSEYELVGKWLWKNFNNAEIEIIKIESDYRMRIKYSDGSSSDDFLEKEGNVYRNPENQMGEYFVINDGFLEMWNEERKFNTLGSINKDGSVAEVPDEIQKEFGFTAKEFVNLYKQSMQTIGQTTNIDIKKETDNGKNITIQYEINAYTGIVATANSTNKKINSLVFIGSGDGSVESGTDIILGALATVMSIENPEMVIEQRNEIGNRLGLLDGSLVEIGEKKYTSEFNIFNVTLTEGIGLMLSAEPND